MIVLDGCFEGFILFCWCGVFFWFLVCGIKFVFCVWKLGDWGWYCDGFFVNYKFVCDGGIGNVVWWKVSFLVGYLVDCWGFECFEGC